MGLQECWFKRDPLSLGSDGLLRDLYLGLYSPIFFLPWAACVLTGLCRRSIKWTFDTAVGSWIRYPLPGQAIGYENAIAHMCVQYVELILQFCKQGREVTTVMKVTRPGKNLANPHAIQGCV